MNEMGDTVLRITPEQLQKISEKTRERERVRLAEELEGFAAVAESLGQVESMETLRMIAAGLRPQPEKRKLTPEEARREGERLLVPGMERLPFTGYDGDESNLPPVRERTDDEEMGALLRRR